MKEQKNKKTWERPDKPIVFQFTHPGSEHDEYIELKNRKELFKLWNVQKIDAKSTHKRKYLCTKGEYIPDGSNESVPTSLYFWGEWEPDSIAIPFDIEENEEDCLPKYCNIPLYLPTNIDCESIKSELGKNIGEIKSKQTEQIEKEDYYYQNTDPFVFGTEFRYATICKPYETLNIKEGSIILFGSTKQYDGQSRFRIDTVFVVRKIIDMEECLKDKNSLHYNTSLRFIDNNDGYSHQMFIGATPQDDVNGMYSFIPASVEDKGKKPRIGTLKIDSDFDKYNCIKGTVNWQGYVVDCEDGVEEFWKSLLKYTYKQGYVPAVKIDMPPMFDSIDDLSDWISSNKYDDKSYRNSEFCAK